MTEPAPWQYRRYCGRRWLPAVTLALASVLFQPFEMEGQVPNAWTHNGSGSWEQQAHWSLGILPAQDHDVLLTNAGWKAVAIHPATAQNFPQSLSVRSVRIASPTNSFNTLLLNYAGVDTPLTVSYSLLVESNSALTVLGSAVQLNGPTGVGMRIGGDFLQDDGARVSGNQIDVGFNGPGRYTLAGGLVNVGHLWVGGPFRGVMEQTGGINSIGIVHLDGGAYFLRDGEFSTAVYFNGGRLEQSGGVVSSNLMIRTGTYFLEGGINRGGVTVPVSDGWSSEGGWGEVLQTGGTNFGAIQIGDFGSGTYTLSNGWILPDSFVVRRFGHFRQFGGIVQSTGTVSLIGGWFDRGGRAQGFYTLEGGNLFAGALWMDTGYFIQHGGTNAVNGKVTFASSTHNHYELSGGLLTSQGHELHDSWVGGFFQSGGVNQIHGDLYVNGNDLPLWNGYTLSGGELQVSNIVLDVAAIFRRTAGTLVQSGSLTLTASRLFAGAGSQQFGPVHLAVGFGSQTNSTLYMPSNSCAVDFADSSGRDWTNTAMLTISGWKGAPDGEGMHRIRFGSNNGGLRPDQLAQVLFRDPPGLNPGLYPARILATGEIVPDPTPAVEPDPPIVQLLPQSGGVMELTVRGEPGASYGIEVSTNLVDWIPWTVETAATNGEIALVDADAPNFSQRYYRARMQ